MRLVKFTKDSVTGSAMLLDLGLQESTLVFNELYLQQEGVEMRFGRRTGGIVYKRDADSRMPALTVRARLVYITWGSAFQMFDSSSDAC